MSICIHTLIIRDVYVSCSNLHTWYLYYIDCGKVLTLRMNFLSLNFIPVSPTTLTNITRKKKNDSSLESPSTLFVEKGPYLVDLNQTVCT